MAEMRIVVLRAACDVVAAEGLRALTFERVAKEAGLTPEDVARDFVDRTQLVVDAFDYADHRAMTTIGEMVKAQTAYERLVSLLTLYIDSESPIIRQDWIFWVEMEAIALFDPSFDQVMSERSGAWREMLAGLVQVCRGDGSVPADVDSEIAATRLMLMQDALGRQCLLDQLATDVARAEMVLTIQRELHHQ